jgi:hypothetical protein
MCPQPDETEDESEMTSIMSAEERSLLQEAARGGAQGRDTAKPPKSEADPVVIPKAAAVPGAAASASAAKASNESKTPTVPPAAKAPGAAAASTAVAPASSGGIPLAEVIPFLLLIAASLYAMSH